MSVEGKLEWKDSPKRKKTFQDQREHRNVLTTFQRVVSKRVWLNQSIYEESAWNKAEEGPECQTKESELHSESPREWREIYS